MLVAVYVCFYENSLISCEGQRSTNVPCPRLLIHFWPIPTTTKKKDRKKRVFMFNDVKLFILVTDLGCGVSFPSEKLIALSQQQRLLSEIC